MPFVYYEYNDPNYVSCDICDGEFFAIYESRLDKDSSGDEIFGVYEQTFTLCFDEFKKTLWIFTIRRSHMIEILVFVNERNEFLC